LVCIKTARRKNPEPDPAIRRLYPDLGPEELLIAEETLDEYLRFTMRMYEQIASDPPIIPRVQSFDEKEVRLYDRSRKVEPK
jgi:hypothetical protein